MVLLLSGDPLVLPPTSGHRSIGYRLENQRNHIGNAIQFLAGSEQAEPAQNTAHEKHHNRTEPPLKHDKCCDDRDSGSLPPGIG
jgi:hypothetical protein